MIERIRESLKKGMSETPRATAPKLLLESAWVTLGPPLLLPNRKPGSEELLSLSNEAQDELIELDNKT